jgi:predicted PurR-regulated permease PerM
MNLYPIWLLFAAIFFAFAYQHWRLAQGLARTFRMREDESTSAELKDFVHDFNQYIESTNAVMTSQNRVAMIGYFVAGLLSLVSMFFSFG